MLAKFRKPTLPSSGVVETKPLGEHQILFLKRAKMVIDLAHHKYQTIVLRKVPASSVHDC